MERTDQKLVRVKGLGLAVSSLVREGASALLLLPVDPQALPSELFRSAGASALSPERTRKRVKVYLDEAVSRQFKSRAYQLERELPECFEEALQGWTASPRRLTRRPTTTIRVYFRVAPSIWADFKARVPELADSSSECVEMAIRQWLSRRMPRRGRR